MGKDMQDVFENKQEELERMLGQVYLDPEQRKLILTAMEFSYSAAYCSRTCDMNGNFLGGQEYDDTYKQMCRELKRIPHQTP